MPIPTTPEAPSVTLTADEAAFLAARLRRLCDHFGYKLPDFASSDESLIRIAGSCIGAILTAALRESVSVTLTETDRSDLRVAANIIDRDGPSPIGVELSATLRRIASAGVKAGDDFTGCRPPMRHIAGVSEETLRRAARGVAPCDGGQKNG